MHMKNSFVHGTSYFSSFRSFVAILLASKLTQGGVWTYHDNEIVHTDIYLALAWYFYPRD